VLHVYAITDSDRPPEAVGLDGADLRVVGERAPFAVVSEHDQVSPRVNEEDLWAHEQVVEELMARAAVLPMRFDATVADEEALRRILDERRGEFEALLDEVRGAVELGVRALLGEAGEDEGGPPDGESPGVAGSEGPGTAYLLARAQSRRRDADLTARIHEPLSALSRRSRQSGPGLRPGLFKAAYLVDRDRVDAFRARVEELDSELGNGRIVCTGPWPAYGFSSEEHA
jgi:gas vesicle protein GvpL/GvpF